MDEPRFALSHRTAALVLVFTGLATIGAVLGATLGWVAAVIWCGVWLCLFGIAWLGRLDRTKEGT